MLQSQRFGSIVVGVDVIAVGVGVDVDVVVGSLVDDRLYLSGIGDPFSLIGKSRNEINFSFVPLCSTGSGSGTNKKPFTSGKDKE